MAAPALAMGAAEEASGSSFDTLSAKNKNEYVLVSVRYFILSQSLAYIGECMRTCGELRGCIVRQVYLGKRKCDRLV